jgi:hypothetical protein
MQHAFCCIFVKQKKEIMKRTLLLIASLIYFTSLSAQSLLLKDSNDQDITGKTVDTLFSPDALIGVYNVKVQNTSATAINVKVRVYEIQRLEGVLSYFCWTSCYEPGTMESPDAMEIGPDAVITDFSGDIEYSTGLKGLYSVKYVFFDADNTTDSSYVILNFNLGTLGRPDNMVKAAKISNAYPNPATSNIYIDYKLPSNVSNAKIKISNLLGNTIEVVDLTTYEGKASFNVSNLKNGVYFYSLMINNSATITRKFVVNR